MLTEVGQWVFQMPDFIHDFGDSAHHLCPTGLNPSHIRFIFHECLDWCFYRVQRWLRKWVGDNKVYKGLRSILGFYWGVNCGFPLRDVALYSVWDLRGSKPVTVWEKQDGETRRVYPELVE